MKTRIPTSRFMRGRMTRSPILAAITVAALGDGCDESPSAPSQGAIVTFSVADECFRVWLTEREQIDAARAAQAGGTARIAAR